MDPVIPHGGGSDPDLLEYRRQFEAIKRDAADLVRGLDAGQLTWRPDPGRWSIADCFFHLNIIADMYAAPLRDLMEKGRLEGIVGKGPFRYGLIGRYFVRSMEPPVKMNVNAPTAMLPPPTYDPMEVVREFQAKQEGLIALIVQAEGLHLKKLAMRSEAVKILRLPLGQWFAFLGSHARRHLWQARQVRNNPNFPAQSS